MRSFLARVFVWLMWGLLLANMVMSLLITRDVQPAVTSVLLMAVAIVPAILPLLAGLVWDDPRFEGSSKWMLMLWVVLPAAMLAVVVVALIIEPPDIPDAWYVLIGVIIWNLLLPIGRLIGRRVWSTTS